MGPQRYQQQRPPLTRTRTQHLESIPPSSDSLSIKNSTDKSQIIGTVFNNNWCPSSMKKIISLGCHTIWRATVCLSRREGIRRSDTKWRDSDNTNKHFRISLSLSRPSSHRFGWANTSFCCCYSSSTTDLPIMESTFSSNKTNNTPETKSQQY